MSQKLVNDIDSCIGCELCVNICPNVFKMVDGKSHVVNQDGDTKENIDQAIQSCPVQSIKWE